MAPFSHLLTDQIVVSRKLTGRDGHGQPNFGPQETHPAAIAESFQRVRDTNGDEKLSAHQVAVQTRFKTVDRVWFLPGPDTDMPQDDITDNRKARNMISHRNDRSRTSGVRLFQAFF